MSATVIYNPRADRERAARRIDGLKATLAIDAGDVEWKPTTHAGHAAGLAQEAAARGRDRVVACGGDGTVHEVVNGLMRVDPSNRPILGIVPIGSGNDVAYASTISRDAETALHDALIGSPAPIDVGVVRSSEKADVYFDNSVGLMFDAAVTIQSRRIRRVYGFPMYLLATIRALLHDHAPSRLQWTMDAETASGDVVMMAVGNGPREGGGFLTNPAAKNDDGVLDVLMVKPVSRLKMFWMLPFFLFGKQGMFKQVTFATCRSISLDADRPLAVHVDGEVWAEPSDDARQLQIEVLHHALRLARPT